MFYVFFSLALEISFLRRLAFSIPNVTQVFTVTSLFMNTGNTSGATSNVKYDSISEDGQIESGKLHVPKRNKEGTANLYL